MKIIKHCRFFKMSFEMSLNDLNCTGTVKDVTSKSNLVAFSQHPLWLEPVFGEQCSLFRRGSYPLSSGQYTRVALSLFLPKSQKSSSHQGKCFLVIINGSPQWGQHWTILLSPAGKCRLLVSNGEGTVSEGSSLFLSARYQTKTSLKDIEE